MKIKHNKFKEYVRELGGGLFRKENNGYSFMFPVDSPQPVKFFYSEDSEKEIPDVIINEVAEKMANVEEKQNRITRKNPDFFKKALKGSEKVKVEGLEQKLHFVVMGALIAFATTTLYLLGTTVTGLSILEHERVNSVGLVVAFIGLIALIWYFIKD